jgi:hypothetical protein
MLVHAEAFWLQKLGCSELEYEDAFCPPLRQPNEFRQEKLRFAVADGASEAAFSRQWAKQLARGFVRGSLNIPLTDDALKPLQETWLKAAHRTPLPWYADEKVASGSFASLLGLELLTINGGASEVVQWRSIAVGDTCVAIASSEKLDLVWPIDNSSSFNNNPKLLGSIPGSNDLNCVYSREGTLDVGSALYLMTDALACWFMKEHESGERPWRSLSDLGTKDSPSFVSFIGHLRDMGEIKNDDVTLLRIQLLA